MSTFGNTIIGNFPHSDDPESDVLGVVPPHADIGPVLALRAWRVDESKAETEKQSIGQPSLYHPSSYGEKSVGSLSSQIPLHVRRR